ncbi:18171_t:CDS:2 [Rhizophagus irregularis]|nr:18171_t:CDS:2 [Rhizophagus irregularis]
MGRETQIGLFTTGANGMNFFVKSKPKVVRRWREETLKQFVYGNHGRMTEDNTDEIEKFRCGLLLQGEDSITEYYSEVKRCNDVVKLCKDHLKNVFINELENKNSVLIKFGYNHPLDITPKLQRSLIQVDQSASDGVEAKVAGLSNSILRKMVIKMTSLVVNHSPNDGSSLSEWFSETSPKFDQRYHKFENLKMLCESRLISFICL